MAEPARWYVVHTYSGYENKVMTNLEKTVENRKRFTHRSQSLCLPSFSSLAFSLYREKCSFLLQERAVTVMGRAQYVNTA